VDLHALSIGERRQYPIMTKLADRNGRRPIYIACVTIFALGSLLAIFSQNFPDVS